MLPRSLILHANGTNRDLDAARALELAGSTPEIVHLNQLRRGERRWADYQLLVLPGGFSYADALGAGKLFALELVAYFADEVRAFVDSGKPVIGICNGFQALVKAGILPGPSIAGEIQSAGQRATLTFNASGHFECRWVTLIPKSQKCVWTRGLSELLYCPVAHGEGRFLLSQPEIAAGLQADDRIALVYASGDYPENPNGSTMDIAGVCNSQGNVLGLMPHPEDHIFPTQHPRWTRSECGGSGLQLFKNGVDYAGGL